MCGEQVSLAANYSTDIPTALLRERCEAELERTRALLDGMPVAIDAAADEISALAGKLGSIPGVSARTVFSRRDGEKQA